MLIWVVAVVVAVIDTALPRGLTMVVVPVIDTSVRDGLGRRVHYSEQSGHSLGNSVSDLDPGFDSLAIGIGIGIAIEMMRIRGTILLLLRRRRQHRLRLLRLGVDNYSGVDASPTVDHCDYFCWSTSWQVAGRK